MKLPPLTALRAFEAAARHGNLSAAARELNVTHAAIAQQVKKLEQWFGTKLIQREGRGVAATGRGATLAAGLGEGFAALQAAVDAMAEDDATRPLKITLTPSFAAQWMMPRLGAFRAAHPEIEIMLNPTSVSIDLVAEDYDVAFRFGDGDWPGLDSEQVLESGHAVFAAASLVAGKRIETPADVAALPWVQELGMDERAVWLKAHGVDEAEGAGRNILHLPGNLILDAIRRGEGVGNTGRTWFTEDIAAGRVVALFDEDDATDIGYWIVTRPPPHREPLKAFLKWVRAEICDASNAGPSARPRRGG
jgi:LysR family glycine cleavage system transcriptional activator